MFHNKFSLKYLGKLGYFMGIEVSYHDSHNMFLSELKYIIDLLQRAKMFTFNPIATLMISGGLVSTRQDDHLTDLFLYRSIVGALQYVTLTRQKISFSINKTCQFIHSQSAIHWQ